MSDTSRIKTYTLVQHSGFSYDGKPAFARAVETRLLNEAEARKVRSAGGLLFDSYDSANYAEHAENYPPGVAGLIPRCTGTFSNETIDDLAIYIPKKADSGQSS